MDIEKLKALMKAAPDYVRAADGFLAHAPLPLYGELIAEIERLRAAVGGERPKTDTFAGRVFVDQLTGKHDVQLSAYGKELPDMTRLYASALAAGNAAQAPEWQPIETAPKDGTEVLLYLDAPWSKIEKARWYEPWKNWQVGEIPEDPIRDEYCGIGSSIPTHWMPLPASPTPSAPADLAEKGERHE